MPRPATGRIVERRNAHGGISRTLRFHAYGKRRTMPLGQVSRDEAERQLGFVLADVARGTWKPAGQALAPTSPVDVPTFHDYADQWWLLHEGQLAPKTRIDYRWRLEVHLIDNFGEMRLDAITFDTVERYMAMKVADGLAEADRRVKIRGALWDQLEALRDRGPVDQHAYLFPTRTGRRQYECKVRTGTLGGAVKRANANLAAKGLPPLPEGLTPHSLRRTFATVLHALAEAPPVVMAEMGHTSPNLALRIYAQVMRLSEDEKQELVALVAGEKARKGTKGEIVPIERARARAA